MFNADLLPELHGSPSEIEKVLSTSWGEKAQFYQAKYERSAFSYFIFSIIAIVSPNRCEVGFYFPSGDAPFLDLVIANALDDQFDDYYLYQQFVNQGHSSWWGETAVVRESDGKIFQAVMDFVKPFELQDFQIPQGDDGIYMTGLAVDMPLTKSHLFHSDYTPKQYVPKHHLYFTSLCCMAAASLKETRSIRSAISMIKYLDS